MDDSITVPQHAVSPPAAHNTGTLPSPSEDVAVLFALKEMNIFKNNKQTNKKTSPVEILPYDKRNAWLQWAPGMWGKCCWPQWRRGRHPVGDGLDMRLCPDTATRLKRGQAAVLSFDWITEAGQRWGKWKKNESRIGWSKTATTNKVWPRLRSSPIVMLHAIWTTLVKLEKTPPARHKTTEDGRAAGKQMKCR